MEPIDHNFLRLRAAYDRMGTYYMNGTGVGGDATRAFAFWQRAAQLGSPHAMTFLANKMDATYDSPGAGFWANIPVATNMLECAFGQGYGPAAASLRTDRHFLGAAFLFGHTGATSSDECAPRAGRNADLEQRVSAGSTIAGRRHGALPEVQGRFRDQAGRRGREARGPPVRVSR